MTTLNIIAIILVVGVGVLVWVVHLLTVVVLGAWVVGDVVIVHILPVGGDGGPCRHRGINDHGLVSGQPQSQIPPPAKADAYPQEEEEEYKERCDARHPINPCIVIIVVVAVFYLQKDVRGV